MQELLCPKCLLIIGDIAKDYSVGFLTEDTIEITVMCPECDTEVLHAELNRSDFEPF